MGQKYDKACVGLTSQITQWLNDTKKYEAMKILGNQLINQYKLNLLEMSKLNWNDQ